MDFNFDALLFFLTFEPMRATLTSKGQITLPVKLRRKFALLPGTVLEFDEHAACLQARKVEKHKPARSVLGCLRLAMPESVADYLDAVRGPVELPRRKS